MFCPNCQNANTTFLFEAFNTHGAKRLSKEKFKILRCNDCGLVFPQVIWDHKLFKKYYPPNYYYPKSSPGNFLQNKYELLCLYHLKWMVGNILKGGKVLDFGCGLGRFLSFLPSHFEKYGIEINPQAVQFIKRHSPEIKIFSNLSRLPERNTLKFDLITLWHVLEHLDNPQEILVQLVNLLKKEGYLILSTPNSSSLGFKISQNHWFHLDTPRHLAIYNLKNLLPLFKKLKLKIIAVKWNWPEYPLDFFWSIYNRFKTKIWFLNLFLGCFILPISLIVKLGYLFKPERAEVITLICQKI